MWTNFKAASEVELVECIGILEKRQEEEEVKDSPDFWIQMIMGALPVIKTVWMERQF